MKRLNYLVGLSILGALILAMIAIVPAIAEAPSIDRVILDFDFVDRDCGVKMPAHLTGKEVTTTFYDKDGAIRGGTLSYGGTSATITYNGHTLTWHDVENVRWQIVKEPYTVEYIGLFWEVSVPGYGKVYGSSGRTVLACYLKNDELICDSEPIHWSGMSVENLEPFCNYMINGK
jgi:hypothetical protein